MKKNGFTLVELLAVIILLALLMMLVYPKVIDMAEKKQIEIEESKKELINNAVLDYMSSNLNSYPQTIGEEYCILLETLDKENLIPVDISDIQEKYNYVRVKIGANKVNSYVLIKAETETDCLK